MQFNCLIVTDGGEPRAHLATLDRSALPQGNVLVRIKHSTINYKDALAVTGAGPVAKISPLVPGIDFAGTVVESSHPGHLVGSSVVLNGWGVGEKHWGGFSELASVDGDWLTPLPARMSPFMAMSLGTAGYTAMLCVMKLREFGVGPEDGPVLVTGAAGGVGGVAIQILKARGYRVVASTRRLEETDYLTGLGASEIVDAKELAEPGKPLGKERWAAAVDCLGGQTLANICAGLRYGGVVAACGLAESMKLPATVAPFILRGITLAGIDSVYAPQPVRTAAWEALAREIDPIALSTMTRAVALQDVAEQSQLLMNGKNRGRIVVDIA